MATYKTEGIILRRAKFGEANLLLNIFTKEFGKVQAMARSACKAQGKLKGHLEPFLYCDFLIVHGRKMDIIANSVIVENFLNLRNSLESFLAGSVVLEIADRMTVSGYRDERLFELILKSLHFIDEKSEMEKKSLWLLVSFFQINIMSLSGFAPHVGKCVFCGEELRVGKNYFSNSLGGVLHEVCAKKCPDASPIDDDTIRLLRFLQIDQEIVSDYDKEVESKLSEIGKLNVKSEIIVKSIFLMKKFIEFNLDQRINSLDVFCNFAREKI